jgi:hypothetical protein
MKAEKLINRLHEAKVTVKLKDLKKGDQVFVEGSKFGTVTGDVQQCGRDYCRVNTTGGTINQHQDSSFQVIRAGLRENDEDEKLIDYTPTVWQTSHDNVEHPTAEAAKASVEKRGTGRVIKFLVSRNYPGLKPDLVHRSNAMWSFNNGRWQAHSIFSGHGAPYADEAPN